MDPQDAPPGLAPQFGTLVAVVVALIAVIFGAVYVLTPRVVDKATSPTAKPGKKAVSHSAKPAATTPAPAPAPAPAQAQAQEQVPAPAPKSVLKTSTSSSAARAVKFVGDDVEGEDEEGKEEEEDEEEGVEEDGKQKIGSAEKIVKPRRKKSEETLEQRAKRLEREKAKKKAKKEQEKQQEMAELEDRRLARELQAKLDQEDYQARVDSRVAGEGDAGDEWKPYSKHKNLGAVTHDSVLDLKAKAGAAQGKEALTKASRSHTAAKHTLGATTKDSVLDLAAKSVVEEKPSSATQRVRFPHGREAVAQAPVPPPPAFHAGAGPAPRGDEDFRPSIIQRPQVQKQAQPQPQALVQSDVQQQAWTGASTAPQGLQQHQQYQQHQQQQFQQQYQQYQPYQYQMQPQSQYQPQFQHMQIPAHQPQQPKILSLAEVERIMQESRSKS